MFAASSIRMEAKPVYLSAYLPVHLPIYMAVMAGLAFTFAIGKALPLTMDAIPTITATWTMALRRHC